MATSKNLTPNERKLRDLDGVYAVSPGDAARYISVTRATIYNLLNSGRLPSTKIGRSRRIPVAALRALIDESSSHSPNSPSKGKTNEHEQ